MLDNLRERFAGYLAEQGVCVISSAGGAGARAMPVRYRSRGLEVDCLLPRWADVAYDLEVNPAVFLVIGDGEAGAARWLEYRGTGRLLEAPDWADLLPAMERGPGTQPEARYRVARVSPVRLDLLDESAGWGARETLEL